MRLLLVCVSLLSATAFGVVNIGDSAPNLCWKDATNQTVCVDDHKDKVRVLVYATGWCPACNEEMTQLAPQVAQFSSSPVIFLSLMAQGDTHGSAPSPQFLTKWKKKHGISFPVLASPKDAGKNFFAAPIYIPNVVIIGKDGKVAYKEVAPEVSTLLAKVKELSAL